MKINIKSVEFRNLFSYGNKWQKFEPDGITFISGLNLNNDRRNFTGKSNLLKIFPYSLFGKVEGLNKQRIINWKNRKNAESYITFVKGNNTYSIHRGIKPDVLEVYKNNELQPSPASKTDLQNQIENDILEMDYKSFMNIVYADLNNSQSVLTMTKPQKRQFLEQIFDLEYYTKLKDSANKKINNINSKIESLNKDIEHYNKEYEDSNVQINKFESELNNINDSSEELERYKSKLTKLQSKNEEAKEQLITLERSKSSLNSEFDKLANDIMKIRYKIKELTRYLVDTNQIQDVSDLESKRNKLKQEIEDSKDTVEHHKDLSTHELQKNKEEWITKKTTLSNEIKRLNEYIKQCEKKLTDKTESDICPTCFQMVDHEHIKNHLQSEIDNTHKQIKPLKEELKDAEQKINYFSEQIRNVEELIKKINKLKEDIYNSEKELDRINKNIEDTIELNNKVKQSEKYRVVINKLETKFSALQQQKDEIHNRTNLVERDIEYYKNIQDEYLEVNRICENLKVNIENEKKEYERINNWIKDYKDKKSKLIKDVEKGQKEIKRLKSTLDYVKVVKDLCDDKEAKSYTLSNKVPVLNQRVNYYLNKAGVNYYVHLDSWLEPTIKGPGIRDCSFDNLSGAERISLMESMRFAFNDINRLQSTTYIDLLILDEIIGSNSLDNIGVQNLMNIVKTKQEEDNSNVLIVSHAPNIGEFEHMIDNFYTIQYDGSYSQIVKN